MNILMMTNTYKPLLGGLERSVEFFAKGFRQKGHRVIIVAPEFESMVPESDVIRIPALQRFNGTDFSVQLPIPGVLTEALGDFRPDLVHAHHPFLLGDTALRMAYKYNVPLVFTHHTLFEQNTHYVSDSETLKSFVVQLATGYANLTDRVFAPSASVKRMLRQRGVKVPIDVVPTGIDLQRFAKGDGIHIREKAGIPSEAFTVGHIGRLAPEKNLEFLAEATALFLKKNKNAHFLVTGKGPSEEAIRETLRRHRLEKRLHFTGPLVGQDLVDAYRAMDVFVFASQSETQGLVLAEAMAAGTPVVAVDAPGVREVVKDRVNGRLLLRQDASGFARALAWMAARKGARRARMKKECHVTASHFSMEKCLRTAIKIYAPLILKKDFQRLSGENSAWEATVRLIQAHWDLTKNLGRATGRALMDPAVDAGENSDPLRENRFAVPPL